MTEQNRKKQDLNKQLKLATDLHGHFGPFLALGVRMGLFGLRQLNLKEGSKELHATVMLKHAPPVSCILDGVQASTKCTVGNTRLTWKESEEVGAIFQLGHSRQRVEVWVKPSVIRELRLRLDVKPSDKETRQIGLDIASRSDEELFVGSM